MASADLLDEDYKPSENEAFMNDRQREYFRRKLICWKEEILRESRETLAALQNENANHPDFADRASSETDRAIELRARDRQRKLISKIEFGDCAPRRRNLWLLRRHRRADFPETVGCPSDCHSVGRSAGAPRAA